MGGKSTTQLKAEDGLDFMPEGLFGQAIYDAMREQNVTRQQLADAADIHKEHVRKLLKGLSYPSPFALKEISRKLKLPYDKLEDMVVVDRITKRYGPILHRFKGNHPELAMLAPKWNKLLPEQKQSIIVQIDALVKSNAVMEKLRKRA
jgi:transcriptional regulator with XRE-family HTH domain